MKGALLNDFKSGIDQMPKGSASVHGFSLIELLVTITIIGILAVTAFSQYQSYRERAFDARAQSDLRNIISAEEAYFADNETFVADVSQLSGFDVVSPAVSAILFADATSWSGSSYHPSGTNTFCFNSSNNLGINSRPGLAAACP